MSATNPSRARDGFRVKIEQLSEQDIGPDEWAFQAMGFCVFCKRPVVYRLLVDKAKFHGDRPGDEVIETAIFDGLRLRHRCPMLKPKIEVFH